MGAGVSAKNSESVVLSLDFGGNDRGEVGTVLGHVRHFYRVEDVKPIDGAGDGEPRIRVGHMQHDGIGNRRHERAHLLGSNHHLAVYKPTMLTLDLRKRETVQPDAEEPTAAGVSTEPVPPTPTVA